MTPFRRKHDAANDVVPDPIAMCLSNLFTAFGKELDRPTGLLYWRALHDVPVPLLDAAVTQAVRSRVWLPKPAEVRQDAETCRAELRKRWAWSSCGACSEQGWRETVVDGVVRAGRCACVEAHQRILRELGADGPALTGPRELEPSAPVDVRLLAAGEDV